MPEKYRLHPKPSHFEILNPLSEKSIYSLYPQTDTSREAAVLLIASLRPDLCFHAY